MARIPLADEAALEGFVKEMHDGAAEEDWATQPGLNRSSQHRVISERTVAVGQGLWLAGCRVGVVVEARPEGGCSDDTHARGCRPGGVAG